jgi:transposase
MTPPPDPSLLSAAEKDALIATLLARVEELVARVAALEAENAALREQLKLPPKTPENSSTPPSQGHKASGGERRKRKSKAHAGAHRPLHPNPTRRVEVVAQHCPHCRADVSGVAQAAQQVYERIEIPALAPDVTRVTLHGGVCPCCARKFKADPPAGLEPGSPFGPNLRAFVLYLRFAHAISFERLARLMSDLLGLAISEGALVNMLADSQPAFARQASLIRARLLAGTIVQSDETSMRVGKRTWWAWVFHNHDSACFLIHPNRSRAVVEEFLGDVRPEFWVSDRLASQMGWAKKGHQVCLAHLLRDVQYAIDAGDDVFAPRLARLLQEACAVGRRRDRLADATLRTYAAKLDRKLDALLRLAPRGSEGGKLLRMIKKFRQHFFVFATNRDLPPTNNGSEQAIRPCVVFRKVTNCFRSEWGAKLYADIRSVLETARRRAIAPLDAIRLTLDRAPLPASP